MELTYKIHDKPPFNKLILTAIQQLLAVIAGTIAVPMVVGNGMSQSAALFGAGIGTIAYLLITKFKSPVFLGSSFSFVGAIMAAFAGAASMSIGYLGLIMGALFGGLVYVILGIITRFVGTKWIDKVAPPVVIGPTVAIIGLTLAPNAIQNILRGSVLNDALFPVANPYLCLLCGLVTLFVSVTVAVYGKKLLRVIPFIIGVLSGYLVASIFTIFGNVFNVDALKIVDFGLFKDIQWLPDFAFLRAFQAFDDFKSAGQFFEYMGFIAVSFLPLSFVCFTEHVADHKNLSFIINTDLLKDPGLDRTLVGDGVGSVVGAFFGGVPNTTYGESISCTALTKNASIWTIFVTAIFAIVVSFIGPVMAFLKTVPVCVVGGLCIALYGFIAASGFQMLRNVNMAQHKNIFVVATILVTGVGGLVIQVHEVLFSPIATALLLGVLVNVIVNIKPKSRNPYLFEDYIDITESKPEEVKEDKQ